MADEDQEVEVTIDATAPAAEAPAAVAADAETVQADPAIAELKRQYQELQAKDADRSRQIDEARASEARAHQVAQRASQEVEQVRSYAAGSELQATVSAMAAATAEADSAARDYQAALEAGEFAKATEAQRKIARAEAKAFQLEQRKGELEAGRPLVTEGRVESRQQEPPADQFEAAIAQATPRTKEFLRSHRDVVTDPSMSAKAAWVHQEAIKRGHVVDTDAYFTFAEQQLYPSSQQQQRPRPMTAAPVSRETSAATGGSSKVSVKLSGGEVKSATDGTLVHNTGPNKGKPIGIDEMARRKAELMKNPKYAASYAH